MKRPIGQKLALTKIDAAEAQLKAAVRMYFENRHLVPIYALANAVREVVGRLGEHLDVETVQKEIAKARGLTVAELIGPLSKKAAFFKHADRDPSGKIELEDDDVEMVLFFACHDFGRVAHGMPIEAQVFEAWAYAATIKRVSDAPLRKQKLIRRMIATFPGIRGAPDRAAQKRIGLEIMERAVTDQSLEMAITREVPSKHEVCGDPKKIKGLVASRDFGRAFFCVSAEPRELRTGVAQPRPGRLHAFARVTPSGLAAAVSS
jgi:hypothetical protein